MKPDPVIVQVILEQPWWAILVQLFSGLVALGIAVAGYVLASRERRRATAARPLADAGLVVWTYEVIEGRDSAGRPRGRFTVVNGSSRVVTDLTLHDADAQDSQGIPLEPSHLDPIDAARSVRRWLLPNEVWEVPVVWIRMGGQQDKEPLAAEVTGATPQLYWRDSDGNYLNWMAPTGLTFNPRGPISPPRKRWWRRSP